MIAILLGTVVRTIWEPGKRWRAGISGFQRETGAGDRRGPARGFAGVRRDRRVRPHAAWRDRRKMLAHPLVVSFGISRALGLPVRLSILIACGNSNAAELRHCRGGACDRREHRRYRVVDFLHGRARHHRGAGIAAPNSAASSLRSAIWGAGGMTVYAVPQVLAATVPAGLVTRRSAHWSSWCGHDAWPRRRLHRGVRARPAQHDPLVTRTHTFFKTVPWLIVAFFGLATLRRCPCCLTGCVSAAADGGHSDHHVDGGPGSRCPTSRNRACRRTRHSGGDAVVVVSFCRQPLYRQIYRHRLRVRSTGASRSSVQPWYHD